MAQYDRVLVLGDFNIHVRCPSASSFNSDFITLTNSFNLTQYVKQPSHDKGHTHTPALLFSHGFCPDDVSVADFVASDHNAILFKVPQLSSLPKPTPLIRSHPLSSGSLVSFIKGLMASYQHAVKVARNAMTII